MHTRESISEEVKMLICKESTKNIFEGEFSDDTLLVEELGFDSVSLIQLIADIESKYNIEFDESYLSIHSLTSIGLLVDYIEKLVGCGNE